MKVLIAKNPKQLDLCLRLLYAENIRFMVEVIKNDKQKVMYEICVNIDGEAFKKLENKYRTLIL